MYTYYTEGVCCNKITFDIKENKVMNVKFYSGCSGNLQGISRLIEGMSVNEAIKRLEGIECGVKTTSCPDQLALALKQAIKSEKLEGDAVIPSNASWRVDI